MEVEKHCPMRAMYEATHLTFKNEQRISLFILMRFHCVRELLDLLLRPKTKQEKRREVEKAVFFLKGSKTFCLHKVRSIFLNRHHLLNTQCLPFSRQAILTSDFMFATV